MRAKKFYVNNRPLRNAPNQPNNRIMLDKACSVCGSRENTEIETVTNVAPKRDEMFPVLLCTVHKGMLAKGELDVKLNAKGDIYFIVKKKA